MQKIEGKLYTPFQKKHHKVLVDRKGKEWNFNFEEELVWERFDANVNRVRASEGFEVSSFRALIDEVALVTISNKNFDMFYRGQSLDYKNNTAEYFKDRVSKSTIFPSICRPERNADGRMKYSVKKSQIIKRYDQLEEMIKLVESKKRKYFKEYYYALFQHYDILPTPLIDITQSLRVAATFALRKAEEGYLYVFGLPYPNQSISYFSDLGMVLIKLQNVLQTDSLRPRYQEGFLVGKYPMVPSKTQGDDLANRMVAKFKLKNTDGKFWDKHFPPMPEEVLYPKDDSIETELLRAKQEFFKRQQ